MPHPRPATVALLVLLLSLAPLLLAAPAQPAVLSIRGDRFLMNDRPFDLWGIRTASATQDDALCQHLIDQLDTYKAHGVNAVTVFYMGSRGGNYDPFTPDGRSINPGHQRRMERIIQACADREMAVIVGIFYQAAPFGLRDAEAVRDAVRTVTRHLRPYRNILINPCNEPNSPEWQKKAHIFNFRDPDQLLSLCQIVHETDPTRLTGAGGYDHDQNETIGRSPHTDALLFDTAGPTPDSGSLYQRFVKAGVTDKPIVNVETFGGWTRQFPRGVFPAEVKQAYFREADAAATHPGLGLFFHNNPWCQHQTEPMRYDLGGQGTEADPGIRWYFEYVRTKIKGER